MYPPHQYLLLLTNAWLYYSLVFVGLLLPVDFQNETFVAGWWQRSTARWCQCGIRCQRSTETCQVSTLNWSSHARRKIIQFMLKTMAGMEANLLSPSLTTSKSHNLYWSNRTIEFLLAYSKFLPAQYKIYQPRADGPVLASIPAMVMCKYYIVRSLRTVIPYL